MKVIGNQECFAIVQDDESKQIFVVVGNKILAKAESENHAREMIETKDWRLIVGLATLITSETIKEVNKNDKRDKKTTN